MSNFWFDDNAFRHENNQANDGEFTDDIFEGIPGGSSIQPSLTSLPNQQMSTQQQANQPFQQAVNHQSPQQHTTPHMQMGTPQVDTLFNEQEFGHFGEAQQHKQSHQGASMFMRQSDNMNNFAAQSPQTSSQVMSPQMPQQSQSNLDQSKQEQLHKMRQQIMHQQMLQRQLQQNQMDARQTQQQGQQQRSKNFGKFSSGMVDGQAQSPQAHPGPQSFQSTPKTTNPPNMSNNSSNNSQFVQATKTNAEASSLQHGVQMHPGATAADPGQQGGNGRPSPAQFAQLQHEIFQMTLNDFMIRRGTPITQTPVINNKRINLFVLDVLGRKIGGPQAVLKHVQTLRDPSPKITEWSSICQKMNLFEGVDVQNDPKTRHQIEKQLGSCYLQFILPYEQYVSTDEGQKDISNRRSQFQRQLISRLQQQQQQQQQQQTQQRPSQQNGIQQSQHPQQNPVSQQPSHQWSQPPAKTQPSKARVQQTGDAEGASAVPSQFRSPRIQTQSPHAMVPTPKINNMPSPSVSVVNSQRKPSQNSTTNNTPPSNTHSPRQPQIHRSRSNSVQRRQSSTIGHAPAQKTETPFPTVPQESSRDVQDNPNLVKKYVPIKKESNSYGDWVLKCISDLGDEIELTKPVFLFAPELGSLNIHALVMSLKNYSRNNPGEASSALNTLLVTTTDQNFAFNLRDAPELLDALVALGLKILDQIITPEERDFRNSDLSGQSTDAIDSVFTNFVRKDGLRGEDIIYNVDSLTGELIEDEDSDIEIDDVFPPHSVQEYCDNPTRGFAEYTQCCIEDFMSALQSFKYENRYHFSKAQTKGALDNSIFLVDNLITITMTLRNLSFTEQSSKCMSRNAGFKKLVFSIVKSVATTPDFFVLQRKRLCLLKDCLLMLDKNAHLMEIESLEEAFLAFLLVTSFGPSLENNSEENDEKFSIPSAHFETYSYLPFSVDVFAKLFVREPKNRAYFQAVLSGSLNISSSNLGSENVAINSLDHHEARSLIEAHLRKSEVAARSGVLSTRAFKLLLSCIPFTMSGPEYTKFILQRSSTILQALFGAKLLIDSVLSDDVNMPLNMLVCRWLTSNCQLILFNFFRITISAITESVKFDPNSGERRVLAFVALKSMILINSLLANVVLLKRARQEGELEDYQEFEICLARIQGLYRVQPENEFVLNTLLTPSVDQDVSSEVLRFRYLMESLG